MDMKVGQTVKVNPTLIGIPMTLKRIRFGLLVTPAAFKSFKIKRVSGDRGKITVSTGMTL
jgi:hypothetical protein